MQKLHRSVIKKLKEHLPGIQVRIVRAVRHVVMEAEYEGKTARAVCGNSPKDEDHAYRNTCTAVCVALGVDKPSFS